MDTMRDESPEAGTQAGETDGGERSAFVRALYSRYSLPILGGVIIGLIATILMRFAGSHLF